MLRAERLTGFPVDCSALFLFVPITQEDSMRNPTPEILSAKQAAKLFQVNVLTIYRHKELPSLRIGRHVRYDANALREHFAQQSLIRKVSR